jgi:hypothetical protein
MTCRQRLSIIATAALLLMQSMIAHAQERVKDAGAKAAKPKVAVPRRRG